MRVVLLTYDFGEYCIRLASSLARHGEIMLVMPEQLVEGHLSLKHPAVDLRLFRKPRLRQAWSQCRTVADIHRHIRQFAPDIIHMQAGHLWFTASLPLLTRFPLVLTVHDPSRHLGDQGAQKTPQWLIDLGTYRAAQVIVHAPQLKEELVGRLRLRSDHVHVVSTVLRGDDSAAPGVGERDGTILFFGRIWPYKGLDYLIRAEPLITKEIPHARIVIAGEGEDFDRYRRMMLHPEKFVVYNHYISDQRRAEMFREASVVALPYVEASQSGVIPIAYRLGKPVVATAVGGLPELVEDGRTGFLVPPRDERQLANAIVRLLRDSSLRHRFGAVGKQKIETQCSPDAVALKTFKIYQEVLKAPRNTHVRHASSSAAS